jgi:hypothetical protein
MQPDLEDKHENAQLGHAVDDRILRVDDAEDGSPKQHARDQLSYDGRLTHALGDDAKDLRRDEKGDKGGQQLGEGVIDHLEMMSQRIPVWPMARQVQSVIFRVPPVNKKRGIYQTRLNVDN